MEWFVGVLGVAAAVVIPIYLHRLRYPRRELRFAVVREPEPGFWQLRVWATGRADIPSASYDAARPIAFRLAAPSSARGEILVEGGPLPDRLGLEWIDAREFQIAPQLLRSEFSCVARFFCHVHPMVTVENPLIDIPVKRDSKVESSKFKAVDYRISATKRRSQVTALKVAVWLTSGSFVLFVVGVSVYVVNEPLGLSLGTPGMLLLPVGLVMLAVIGIRRTIGIPRSDD
jgi:hypothetical protein